MKNKTQKRLTLLVGMLITLGLFFIVKDFSNNFRTPQQKAIFTPLKSSEIEEITITDGTTNTRIIKKNNRWVTTKGNTEFSADERRITPLLETIASLERSDAISTNQQKHKDLGIDKQKITFRALGKTHTVYVGNPNGLKHSIRINNESEVFPAKGFEGVFSPLDYRDLSIKAVEDVSKVTAITYISDESRIYIEKRENEWYLEEGKISQDRVNAALNELSTLQAEDILTTDPNLSLETLLVIEIKENGQLKKVEFYPADDEKAYVKIGDNMIYQLSASAVTSLIKNESAFTE